MSAVLHILLAWLLTVATCVALGTWVKRALKLDLNEREDYVFRFLLGAPALSLLVFALCSAKVFHKGVVYAIAALSVLSVWRSFKQSVRIPWHWTILVFAFYALFYSAHAMAPEMSPDGMSYHLGLVARYYREHGFEWYATNMYAYLSQGMEMLFLFAFAVGKHSAAAMIHFTFLLLVPVLLGIYAGRVGWLAGLFVFLLPVVGIDGISAYNDVALAVVSFGCFYAMERWRESESPAWVGAAAILAGFGFSIKYTAVVLLIFLLPAWRLWPRLMLAGLWIVPWLAKNWLWSGNPFAPFFNAWFENPWFSADFEQGYRAFLRHYDLAGFREWFQEVFSGGPRLSGTLGPLALLLPLGFVGWREAKTRRLLLAALCLLAIYPLNVGTRFLIPALPFLSLALMQAIPRLSVALPMAAAILSWPAVMNLYSSPYCWRLDRAPIRAAFRLETEDGFLTRKSAGYITSRLIERLVPEGESVYVHTAIPESYTSRNIIVAYQSTIGLKIQNALAAPGYPPYQPQFVYRCPASRIEVAKDSTDTWSIIETLPRSAEASCNRMPGDAALLRDGNWLSRWRTWGPARAGDYCQLSGNGPYEIWSSGDQWQIELKGCAREVVARPADFRAEARRYVRSLRVNYLAIDKPDFNARDMIDHADLWGLELIAERGTMRLYRWRRE